MLVICTPKLSDARQLLPFSARELCGTGERSSAPLGCPSEPCTEGDGMEIVGWLGCFTCFLFFFLIVWLLAVGRLTFKNVDLRGELSVSPLHKWGTARTIIPCPGPGQVWK